MRFVRYICGVALLLMMVSTGYSGAGPEYETRKVAEKVEEKLNWPLEPISGTIRASVLSVAEFPWDLVSSVVKDGSELDIMKVLRFELPFLVAVALGVLLGLIVPVCGLCFCCCRCCGRCGGRLTLARIQKQKKCSKCFTATVLLVSLFLTGVLACFLPVAAERLMSSPGLAVDMVDASMHDLPLFLQKFGEDSYEFVDREINTVVMYVNQELTDMPSTLSASLTSSTEHLQQDIETAVSTLTRVLDELEELKPAVDNTVDQLLATPSSELEAFDDDLAEQTQTLADMKSQCKDQALAFCDTIPVGPSEHTTRSSIQLAHLKVIVSELVNKTSQFDIASYQTLASGAFESIEGEIATSSSDTVSDMRSVVNGIPQEVLPLVSEVKSLLNVSSLFDLSEFIEEAEGYIGKINDVPLYKNLVLYGLAAVYLTVCLSCLLGLCLGCCCTRPPTNHIKHGRSCCSCCGCLLLLCPVVVGVLFLFYLALIGAVLLLVGTNLTIACSPLEDLTALEKVLDKGGLMNLNISPAEFIQPGMESDLSFKEVVERFREGDTLFSIFNLSSLFNLSSAVEVSSFEIDLSTVYRAVNDTVDKIVLMDSEMKTSLTSNLLSPAVTVTTVTDLMLTDLRELNLVPLIQTLTGLAASLPSEWYADGCGTAADEFTLISSTPLMARWHQLTDNLENLTTAISELQTGVDSLLASVTAMQSFIDQTAAGTVIQAAEEFADNLKSVPEHFLNTVTIQLSTYFGETSLLGDMYDAVVGCICTHFLNAFNVFWASLYLGTFLLVVVIVSAAKMSKYFRKPDDALKSRKVSGREPWKNTENNTSQNSFHLEQPVYKVWGARGPRRVNRIGTALSRGNDINRRNVRRKRFHTGSSSPQLIAVRSLATNLPGSTSHLPESTGPNGSLSQTRPNRSNNHPVNNNHPNNHPNNPVSNNCPNNSVAIDCPNNSVVNNYPSDHVPSSNPNNGIRNNDGYTSTINHCPNNLAAQSLPTSAHRGQHGPGLYLSDNTPTTGGAGDTDTTSPGVVLLSYRPLPSPQWPDPCRHREPASKCAELEARPVVRAEIDYEYSVVEIDAGDMSAALQPESEQKIAGLTHTDCTIELSHNCACETVDQLLPPVRNDRISRCSSSSRESVKSKKLQRRTDASAPVEDLERQNKAVANSQLPALLDTMSAVVDSGSSKDMMDIRMDSEAKVSGFSKLNPEDYRYGGSSAAVTSPDIEMQNEAVSNSHLPALLDTVVVDCDRSGAEDGSTDMMDVRVDSEVKVSGFSEVNPEDYSAGSSAATGPGRVQSSRQDTCCVDDSSLASSSPGDVCAGSVEKATDSSRLLHFPSSLSSLASAALLGTSLRRTMTLLSLQSPTLHSTCTGEDGAAGETLDRMTDASPGETLDRMTDASPGDTVVMHHSPSSLASLASAALLASSLRRKLPAVPQMGRLFVETRNPEPLISQASKAVVQRSLMRKIPELICQPVAEHGSSMKNKSQELPEGNCQSGEGDGNSLAGILPVETSVNSHSDNGDALRKEIVASSRKPSGLSVSQLTCTASRCQDFPALRPVSVSQATEYLTVPSDVPATENLSHLDTHPIDSHSGNNHHVDVETDSHTVDIVTSQEPSVVMTTNPSTLLSLATAAAVGPFFPSTS